MASTSEGSWRLASSDGSNFSSSSMLAALGAVPRVACESDPLLAFLRCDAIPKNNDTASGHQAAALWSAGRSPERPMWGGRLWPRLYGEAGSRQLRCVEMGHGGTAAGPPTGRC